MNIHQVYKLAQQIRRMKKAGVQFDDTELPESMRAIWYDIAPPTPKEQRRVVATHSSDGDSSVLLDVSRTVGFYDHEELKDDWT